ncbi:MAG TPA: LTA synthase family protein, partial [Xanthobacteraceae bacterium]|nr:LTA synthase family protein [Xanthobacteraceae bacterium]
MPPSVACLTSLWAAGEPLRARLASALIAALHVCALGLLLWTEIGFVPKLAFCLTWGLLNFFWLAVLRRPAVSAALSLALIVVLILLSRLKYEIVWMTANFLDVMIINVDTVSFLLAVKPELYRKVLVALSLILPALALIWCIDPFRVRLRTAAAGFVACIAALLGISLAFPQEEWDTFVGESYVSKFARSGVTAITELTTRGYMDSAAAITDRLRTLPNEVCVPGGKPPHVILVHDESSFDIRVLPGIKVGADYGDHFRSFDGKRRHFVSESAGGA